jgi:hypothetical protein
MGRQLNHNLRFGGEEACSYFARPRPAAVDIISKAGRLRAQARTHPYGVEKPLFPGLSTECFLRTSAFFQLEVIVGQCATALRQAVLSATRAL